MRKKGFTLIELLIVVAIIGLLATLLIIALSGKTAKSRDAKRVSDLRTIEKALELYKSDNNNRYPYQSTWGNLTTDLLPYLPKMPAVPTAPSTDDSTPNDWYALAVDTTRQKYCLYAIMETSSNKLESTDKDVVDCGITGGTRADNNTDSLTAFPCDSTTYVSGSTCTGAGCARICISN